MTLVSCKCGRQLGIPYCEDCAPRVKRFPWREVLKEAMVISYFMVLGAAVLAALLWITKWL